jgi:multisubunit Na+/H+ antiporter MnhG subunit
MYRHRFDAISFIFGLIFVSLAFIAPAREWFPTDYVRWLAPGAVLLLGVGIAVSAIASSRADES